MSYIRMTSEGRYVPLIGGSGAYWYDDGEKICGFGTYPLFTGAIYGVFQDYGASREFLGELELSLQDSLGPLDLTGSYTESPELFDVACHVAFDRFDMDIPIEVVEAMGREALSQKTECDRCGDEHRGREYCHDCWTYVYEEDVGGREIDFEPPYDSPEEIISDGEGKIPDVSHAERETIKDRIADVSMRWEICQETEEDFSWDDARLHTKTGDEIEEPSLDEFTEHLISFDQ